ncbi:aspartyl/asparaginyl beta-hydroxylase domain-containing protein [Candidatus Odyssella acanthamoebae]|uniref:aspartyl/asparaginyl beta-hydroxylase domain-containing protein n=1 Tax=Candidatus Odyssella acanthamoebae TaxID=91604 RepID=UPI000690059F|nr:aspartyl/asparaginyl beta-hydroxylase domain-containing protein [Candidatus Paracaedibacter acanthamoebae]
MFYSLSLTKLSTFVVFIVSAFVAHFRGKVKYKLMRQITDHSTFMAPINCFMYMFSKVPNTPYLDRRLFPELDIFKDNWQIIRQEALQLLEQGNIKSSEKRDDIGFNSFFKRGWKRFYLKWYSDPLPSAVATCPKTLELIAKVSSVKAAMFTFLPAGSRLGLHRDPYAGSLRYHLGLITPNSNQCFIEVDGERYVWQDGEDVLFDETYLHQAENQTDVDRLIFFCDVARPMSNRLTTFIQWFFGRFFITTAAAQNTAKDPVGVLNQFFKYIFMIHTSTRGLKRTYPFLHKILKFGSFAGLVYLIFIW